MSRMQHMDNFLKQCLAGSNHCYTDGRNVWTKRCAMVKNIPSLVISHTSILFSQWIFELIRIWNNFEMRLLNLRINFYLLRTFFFGPHLGSFLCCFFFHKVSAKFHLWALSEDSGFKSYPSRLEVYLSKTWCDRQQLWKAVITRDAVTRLIIPIRGRGKSPEEGQRWNLAET